MATIYVCDREGAERSIQGTDGFSLMETLRAGGFEEILAICGGCASCATCHVYVDAAFLEKLSPMSLDEDDLLDASAHRRPESRLSCQIRVSDALDGLRVTIAPED
ncbi:2Fe-2S iron-sulfur cluster-binding protein [Propylenella binzhouense]|uniref:2Fe-2S iron-sulfur cluster binding domain-containing protein n=1 Tax=Propylenella binzhouense TaxID=2555902 RepID=A0A964WTY2_9HYPH|nr:2Fe-2S iron-sulfur cluster binding domain-containing protein [Propylenella binzhouense]